MAERALILCGYFAPDNAIASIRMTKMAKYLTLNGYDVTVAVLRRREYLVDAALTDDLKYPDLLLEHREVSIDRLAARIRALRGKRMHAATSAAQVTTSRSHQRSARLDGLSRFVRYLCEVLLLPVNVARAQRLLKHLPMSQYTVLISTYSPLWPHYVAQHLKKRNNRVCWVADFRDQVYDSYTPTLFVQYAQRFASRLTTSANFVVGVSSGVLDSLGVDRSRCRLIPNGFDPDDIRHAQVVERASELTFAFAGQLYGGRRKLTPFFRALRDLVTSGDIDASRIQVCYAGKSGRVFFAQARQYGMESSGIDMGLLSRRETLGLELRSDILLNATWNTAGSTGVVTGKMLEYLMVGKPVITIVCGDLPNSEAKTISELCRLGYCYEEACDSSDYAELKAYVKTQYETFVASGFVTFDPDRSAVNEFDYSRIIQKLIDLLPRGVASI